MFRHGSPLVLLSEVRYNTLVLSIAIEYNSVADCTLAAFCGMLILSDDDLQTPRRAERARAKRPTAPRSSSRTGRLVQLGIAAVAMILVVESLFGSRASRPCWTPGASIRSILGGRRPVARREPAPALRGEAAARGSRLRLKKPRAATSATPHPARSCSSSATRSPAPSTPRALRTKVVFRRPASPGFCVKLRPFRFFGSVTQPSRSRMRNAVRLLSFIVLILLAPAVPRSAPAPQAQAQGPAIRLVLPHRGRSVPVRLPHAIPQ
jgi:hypothetical protein